jgi:hypothetical protein
VNRVFLFVVHVDLPIPVASWQVYADELVHYALLASNPVPVEKTANIGAVYVAHTAAVAVAVHWWSPVATYW